MDNYSLSDSYVNVSGGGIEEYYSAVTDVIKKYSGLVLAILLILVVLVIYLWFKKESFMPTSTMKYQKLDGLGFSEHLEQPRSASYFAKDTEGKSMAFAFDPKAGVNQPGSLGYEVLHSSDFDCGKRTPITDDAWGWMQGVSTEPLAAGKSPSDNRFSKVLSGL